MLRGFFIIVGAVSTPLAFAALVSPKWAYFHYRRLTGGCLFTWETQGKGPRLVRMFGLVLLLDGITFLSIGLFAEFP